MPAAVRLAFAGAALTGLMAGGGIGMLTLVDPALAMLTQLQQEEIALKKMHVLKLRRAPQGAVARAEQSRRLLAAREPLLTDAGGQAAIMHSIDALGQARGLHFTLFKPVPASATGEAEAFLFMAVGGFRQLVRFTEDIARLPQIVILDQLQLRVFAATDAPPKNDPQAAAPTAPLLTMRATAHTYSHAMALAAAANDDASRPVAEGDSDDD